MLKRFNFENLDDNEFKLLSNIVIRKKSLNGIVEIDGDGYETLQERIEGYKSLKRAGLIYFNDDDLIRNRLLAPNDITLLIEI